MGCEYESDGPEEIVLQLRRRDRRFGRNVYYFVLDALDYTMNNLGRTDMAGEDRHVGARELLTGITDMAAEQFGPMATEVFKQWGIRSTEDFGEVVFNLIESGLLSRREEDSRLDFIGGDDFNRVFEQRFRVRLASIRTNN